MPRKPSKLTQPGLDGLLTELRGLIQQARQQALRPVDIVQVSTYWEVGRHIVEFGKRFDASNLYKMTRFYRLFPILDAVRPKLSWTHYRHRWNNTYLMRARKQTVREAIK